jgi:hypothetical protein
VAPSVLLHTILTVAVCIFLAVSRNGASAFASPAKRAPEASSPTFVYNDSSTDYVFSLRVVNELDLYLWMSVPSTYSWFAVGTGSQMQKSMMLLAYTSLTADGVQQLSLSPRTIGGHSEPYYDSSINLEPTNGTDVNVNTNGRMIASAICRNCTKWTGGNAVSVSDAQQSFIFAAGHDTPASDKVDLSITRHSLYGTFSQDVTQAASTNAVAPIPNMVNGRYFSLAASQAEDIKQDHDWALIIHAVIMIIAFVLFFPAGVLVLRVMERVVAHGIIQFIAFALVFIGFCAGIYLSTEYNRVSNASTICVIS